MTSQPEEPPKRGEVRASYDHVTGEYAHQIGGELALKPLDRALLGRFAERVRGTEPVAELEAESAALQTRLLKVDSSAELRVFSAGYQLRSLGDLVDILTTAGSNLLVDVREVAWSNRPDFKRRRMEAGLAAAGIGYIHAKYAGNPKRLRSMAGSHRECLEMYGSYLAETPTIVDQLEADALRWAAKGLRPCFFCYERHPDDCHRSILLDTWAVRRGGALKVQHLATEGAPRFVTEEANPARMRAARTPLSVDTRATRSQSSSGAP